MYHSHTLWLLDANSISMNFVWQGILTTLSQSNGEYKYDYATVPFLAEIFKVNNKHSLHHFIGTNFDCELLLSYSACGFEFLTVEWMQKVTSAEDDNGVENGGIVSHSFNYIFDPQ